MSSTILERIETLDRSRKDEPTKARIRVLGPVEVVGHPSGDRRMRSVLACLVANRGRAVPVSALIWAAWREAPPASAKKTIQAIVLQLRRELGVSAIEHLSGHYLLDPGVVVVDADELTELVRRARAERLDGNPTPAVAFYQSALALWRGDAYSLVDPECLPAAELRQLEELYCTVHEELIGCLLDDGQASCALPLAEAHVARDPLRESAWVVLAQAYEASGCSLLALRACARARRAFVEELGCAPGPEICGVEQRLLR